jgi:prepilin-type N-terminal cleavage/methylation domain-containing protein
LSCGDIHKKFFLLFQIDDTILYMKKEKGFTLIELLIVIAIIAILATVVMTGLNGARMKARDAKRLNDIKQLQKALDLYSDTCGGYPPLGNGAYVGIGVAGGLQTTTQTGTCNTQTFADYMSTMPVNPTPGGADYQYCSTFDGNPVGAASCSDADGDNTSYQITFTTEETRDALIAGPHVATPTGIQ